MNDYTARIFGFESEQGGNTLLVWLLKENRITQKTEKRYFFRRLLQQEMQFKNRVFSFRVEIIFFQRALKVTLITL